MHTKEKALKFLTEEYNAGYMPAPGDFVIGFDFKKIIRFGCITMLSSYTRRPIDKNEVRIEAGSFFISRERPSEYIATISAFLLDYCEDHDDEESERFESAKFSKIIFLKKSDTIKFGKNNDGVSGKIEISNKEIRLVYEQFKCKLKFPIREKYLEKSLTL